jgi:uncharacterized membrane protein YccC
MISINNLISSGQSFIKSILDMLVNGFWSIVSSALSPLSSTGKIGIVLGIVTLTLIGIQSSRQGYEGRVTQATAFIGFVSTVLVFADFIPPRVVKSLVVFVIIGGIVSAYNLKSYFAGDTESADWYDAYKRLFGSLTLAAILLVLVLQYVVGVNLPLLP